MRLCWRDIRPSFLKYNPKSTAIPEIIPVVLICTAGIILAGRMHLYLALLLHRDYFRQPDSSLSCFFAPQGLFPPAGCISILIFCSSGIISAGRIHPQLALLLHRDYFGRLDSSLSGSFPPQGLFCPGLMHLYLAFLFHRDYFNRPDSSLSGSFAPQGLFQPPGFISICLFCSTGIIPAVRIHLYLAFLAYKWYASSIFSAPFAIIPDITKAGNLENTRFPASGLPEVESEHSD